MENSRTLMCRVGIAWVVMMFTLVGAQNTTMGNMTMPATNVTANTTTMIPNATANTTVAATSTNATAITAAANATAALQTQCGRLPMAAAAMNQSVQANGFFLNGSCYLSTYMGNVAYSNISSTCTRVMKSTNSTAMCQMLQTTNTGPINTLISNKLIQATDKFFIGLSRAGCNGTWKWDNANGSITAIQVNSTQFKGLPGQNSSCGLDNVMFSSTNNNGMLTGSSPNVTGNVLLCECRIDYGLYVSTFKLDSRTGFPTSASLSAYNLGSSSDLLTPNYPREETSEEATRRFEIECEFVQSLANPHYLNYLAQRGYFKEQYFINYLRYLLYFKRPEYARTLKFPQCLYMLEAVQHTEFREALVLSTNAKEIEDQLLLQWHFYLRKRARLFQYAQTDQYRKTKPDSPTDQAPNGDNEEMDDQASSAQHYDAEEEDNPPESNDHSSAQNENDENVEME